MNKLECCIFKIVFNPSLHSRRNTLSYNYLQINRESIFEKFEKLSKFENLIKIFQFEGWSCFFEIEKQIVQTITTRAYIVSNKCFRNFIIASFKTCFAWLLKHSFPGFNGFGALWMPDSKGM